MQMKIVTTADGGLEFYGIMLHTNPGQFTKYPILRALVSSGGVVTLSGVGLLHDAEESKGKFKSYDNAFSALCVVVHKVCMHKHLYDKFHVMEFWSVVDLILGG